MTNLVFLQEFQFDGDITTQPLIFVSMDLIVMLSHLDADHGSCISGAQTQLFQIGPIGIKFKPACETRAQDYRTPPPNLPTRNLIELLPRVFIQPNGHQGILHGFVDQRVDAGDKEVYGA